MLALLMGTRKFKSLKFFELWSIRFSTKPEKVSFYVYFILLNKINKVKYTKVFIRNF